MYTKIEQQSKSGDQLEMKTFLTFALLISAASAEYLVGLGIADVTGPIAEIGFVSITIALLY